MSKRLPPTGEPIGKGGGPKPPRLFESFPGWRGRLDPQNRRFHDRILKNKKLKTSGIRLLACAQRPMLPKLVGGWADRKSSMWRVSALAAQSPETVSAPAAQMPKLVSAPAARPPEEGLGPGRPGSRSEIVDNEGLGGPGRPEPQQKGDLRSAPKPPKNHKKRH